MLTALPENIILFQNITMGNHSSLICFFFVPGAVLSTASVEEPVTIATATPVITSELDRLSFFQTLMARFFRFLRV
jgi:hypothetical protein